MTTKVRKVSYKQFMEAMEAAVAERGEDYIYPKFEGEADDYHDSNGLCRYSLEDGTPACIIGEVLNRLNPEWLPPHDLIRGATSVLSDIGPEAFYRRDYGRIVTAATEAQSSQDRGNTWGDALRTARYKAE